MGFRILEGTIRRIGILRSHVLVSSNECTLTEGFCERQEHCNRLTPSSVLFPLPMTGAGNSKTDVCRRGHGFFRSAISTTSIPRTLCENEIVGPAKPLPFRNGAARRLPNRLLMRGSVDRLMDLIESGELAERRSGRGRTSGSTAHRRRNA